jgi:hypothetical protein
LVSEDLASGKITLGELSGGELFDIAYKAVTEGLRILIYGGNLGKAA